MNLLRYTIGLSVLLFSSFYSFSQTQTVGTFVNNDNALDGYTLIFPFSSKDIYLINNCGQKVHEWNTATPTLVAYLQPNGDLVKAGMDTTPAFGNPGMHGIIERYNWAGTKTWSHEISNDSMILHHDIEIMPNGNILVNAWHKIDAIQKQALGRDTNLMSRNDALWDEVIMELKPRGTKDADIVWQWRASDHLIQDFDQNLPKYGTVSDHPELLNINYATNGSGVSMDWLHFNSITYNENLDQILLSCLTFNEIFIIDHSANTIESSGGIGGISGKGGDFIYRWGNPAAYKKGTSNDKKLFGQHDPNWIKYGENSGKIIVFNNGQGRNYSSADILELPYSGQNYALESNGTYGPSAPSYSYTKPVKTDFFSPVMANAEILPNGNLFACEATKGKFTEYDFTTDSIVWEYVNPIGDVKTATQGEAYSGRTFRAYKYPSNYDAFSGRTLTPGLPLEIDPWPSACNGIDTTTVQDTTTEDTTNVSVQNLSGRALTIYPNPSKGSVSIKAWNNIEGLKIADITGKVVVANRMIYALETVQLDLSEFGEGIYIISYQTNGYTKTERLILTKE